MKTYTVIAVYADDFSRYATSVEAENPEQAEFFAQEQAALDNAFEGGSEPLIIAGVIEGSHWMVA